MNFITFDNNGAPYTFSDHSCGGGKHLSIEYSDIVSIQIKADNSPSQDKGLGKFLKNAISKIIPKYVIQINYYPSRYNRNSVSTKIVYLKSNEIEQAKSVVAMVEKALMQQKRREEENRIKLEQSKKTDTVDCIDENGNHTKIWKREFLTGDYVLVADGGKTYHTHADCFESWKDWMRAKFKGWKKISLAEAKAQGLTACKLCEKYYDFDEESSEPDDEED